MKLVSIDTIRILNVLKEHNLLKVIVKNGMYYYKHQDNKLYDHISYNSKDIKGNTLFFCKGNTFKYDYLREAINNGVHTYISETSYHSSIDNEFTEGIIVNDIQKAMAVIAMEFYNYPQNKLSIYCYTGTKGKTTTAYFTKKILDHIYGENKVAMYTTMENSIDGITYVKSYNSTPESLDLYKMMHESTQNGITHLVMEASSQGYKKNRLYNLKFDVGIFLNITPDHISPVEHPDFEDYLSCKLQLIHNSKKVIANYDSSVYKIIEEICNEERKPILNFSSENEKADFYLNIRNDFSFSITNNINKSILDNLNISLLGDFNIYNVFSAISLIQSEFDGDVNFKDIIKDIRIPGRMENITFDNKYIYVDYAHNYVSLDNLISLVKQKHLNSKVNILIGSTGNKAESRRKEFGSLLNLFADHVFLTADDPDFESPMEICNEIASYIEDKSKIEIIIDREQAIQKAIASLKDNQVLIIAGKGADPYQKVNGIYEPYLGDFKIAKKFITSNSKESKI